MKPEESVLGALEFPESLRDMAYRAIRRAILSNELMPGDVYSEPSLAKRLGISRTPVREALRGLVARGFLEIVRNKGYRVKILKARKIQDLYHFRRILEKAVLEDITPILTDEALTEIESILAQLAATDDTLRYLELDRKFHSYLVALTNNPFVVNSFENLMELRDWVSSRTLLVSDRLGKSRREHLQIFRMLKRRDPKGAVRAMERHLLLAGQSVLTPLSEKEGKGRPRSPQDEGSQGRPFPKVRGSGRTSVVRPGFGE